VVVVDDLLDSVTSKRSRSRGNPVRRAAERVTARQVLGS
jgi:hypothetical protein